jgi:hypothetical protein
VISHGPDSARSRPGVNSGGTARQAVGRDRPTSTARHKASVVSSSIPFGPARPSLLGIRAVLRSSPICARHCATASALQVRVAGERTTKTGALTSAGPMGVLEDMPASHKRPSRVIFPFVRYRTERGTTPHGGRCGCWKTKEQRSEDTRDAAASPQRRPIPRLNRRCRLGAACSFMHDAPLKNTPPRARRHRNH